MKAKKILLGLFSVLSTCAVAQSNYYDLNAGNGYGLRFWGANDNYKMSMGNSAEYFFGPVQDFSIKTSMAGGYQRGWTWGSTGQTPIAALSTAGHMQVAGNFNTLGSLGIGTSAGPLAKLQVCGNAVFSPNGGNLSCAYIRGNAGFSTPTTPDYTFWFNDQVGIFHPGTNIIGFTIGGVEAMRINPNGSVSIGTNTSGGSYRLAVEGKIGAREVVVTNATWADFVFSADYKLKSLNEVEDFIKENKHLPEIPSASEIEKNGLSMGEIQAKQMQKIEELTLYLIEQNKLITQQNKKIEALESMVKSK